LINTLAESKITSDDIKIKVAEAEKTELSIDQTREVKIYIMQKPF
jgi:dynein heavy chain